MASDFELLITYEQSSTILYEFHKVQVFLVSWRNSTDVKIRVGFFNSSFLQSTS